ncbi:MAG TPA: hypothetical protein ENH10_04230 [Bacteroidetes bacterium]|nr:hypothetical protein [Bacteroidota bacterium]HEX04352.1 hypothetical protein [Bacteroidota bacterium]
MRLFVLFFNFNFTAEVPAFNPKVKLVRTKTLMQGNDCCYFRYTIEHRFAPNPFMKWMWQWGVSFMFEFSSGRRTLPMKKSSCGQIRRMRLNN